MARSSSWGESPAPASSGSSHDGSPRCRCLRSRRADQRRVARSRRGCCDRRHPACGWQSRRLSNSSGAADRWSGSGAWCLRLPHRPGGGTRISWAQRRGVLGCLRGVRGADQRFGVVGVALHPEPHSSHQIRPEPDCWDRDHGRRAPRRLRSRAAEARCPPSRVCR